MSSTVRIESAFDPDAKALLLEDEPQGPYGGPSENWRECFPEIIAISRAMQGVMLMVRKVARSTSSVLICGESGTGKELIASALHRLSLRSTKPFVAVNCSAIPENLLESEMFGHEKGAFTGAHLRRAGFFEKAAFGTIFLDEIGDMPLSLQAKLLRVLQEKQFTPIGSRDTIKADVRIVAATNLDLKAAVARGDFRQDLYYRLNVLPITVPPLRERDGDALHLIEHFLELAARKNPTIRNVFFTPDSLELLAGYEWPGNVRELQNLIERLVVINGPGAIGPAQLPSELLEPRVVAARQVPPLMIEGSRAVPLAMGPRSASNHAVVTVPSDFSTLPIEGLDLISFIEGLENTYILQALERTGNNKNKAAKLLGLNRTTLVERIKKRKLLALNNPSREL